MAEKQHDHRDRGRDQQHGHSGHGGANPRSGSGEGRLGAGDTRRYFDDYVRYRFGQTGSPEDFANRAGVSADVVKDLLSQKRVPEADFDKVAAAINVSRGLGEEIFGYRPMPELMRRTLDRFFDAQLKAGPGETAASHGDEHERHKSKGTHAA